MKPREAWGCTLAMHVGVNELTENKEKAQAFLETFFPEMDEPRKGQSTQTPLQLLWQSVTELEIQQSLRAMKGSTSPGEDGLLMLVWKHLWKPLKRLIARIFTASINLAYHLK